MSRKNAAAQPKQRRNAKAAPADEGLRDPALYINRELSLLAFQRRVLEEAADDQNPLLDRAKFLAILGSNLDEFFMVRVAGLIAQADARILDVGPDGMSPAAQLVSIRREVKKLLGDALKCLHHDLLPALKAEGIEVHDYASLTPNQLAAAERYFDDTLFPVLTPLAFDPGRPFPHISNLSLNLAVVIRDRRGVEHFARVKVPDSLPQLVALGGSPRSGARGRAVKRMDLVWIEQVIAANLSKLFPGMEVVEAHPFHITRDAELAIKELEAEDLLETIEEGVRQRRFGSVVRLKVTEWMPQSLVDILSNNLELEPADVYRTRGPLALKRLMSLYAINRPDLKEAPFLPATPKALSGSAREDDIFSLIRREDILLHHPFESFQPVIEFLRAAARDPNVLAIKIVLYRVGRNSPVVEALMEAMENGKQVAVLVELKARFDEESNIEWARALEKVGVHVVYGLVGLKIHCKVAMVVRKEPDAIRRYVHIATGNYNSLTAHLYTDIGLFTANPAIGDDVTDLFNSLTGYSAKSDYDRLLVSPVNFRSRFEALIDREIDHQKHGRGGHLIFKMNSMVDPQFVRALYRASRAGVKIDLIVRGICSLRPGIEGLSENIRVVSIVGRFLEHSRIYYFRNGGKAEIYAGSADLMPRNLDRRVEVLFPLEGERLIRRIHDDVLKVYLSDTVKARQMNPDGTYTRRKASTKNPVDSQGVLLRRSRNGRHS